MADQTKMQSEKMLATRQSMVANRENRETKCEKLRFLEQFEPKSEEGKKARRAAIDKLIAEIEAIDAIWRGLEAKLEEETVEHIMDPAV